MKTFTLQTILFLALCGVVCAEQPREERRAAARSGITIQQPASAYCVSTTVICPDAGTVLLSGAKRISEEQVEQREEQLAAMFTEHNKLLAEHRLDEALQVAKRAAEFAPEEPAVQVMLKLSQYAVDVHLTTLTPDYKLRVFDIIMIDVVGTPSAHPIVGLFAIEPGGFVQLGSGYGYVRIAGLTVEEAQEAITKHLTGTAYMQLNNLTVTVKLQRMGNHWQDISDGQPRPPMPLSFQPVPQPYIEPQFSILPPQPVCRDESINLGIYGFMHVGGLTDAEVRNAIESYLAAYWERATAEVHAQVEDFLNQRRAPQSLPTPLMVAQLPPVAQQRPESERRIMLQLEMPATVNVNQTFTLVEAVNLVCNQIDLVPFIDRRAFQEADVSTDAMVTIPPANGIKARSILNVILEQHGLAYVVKNEMLNITTKQAARGHKLVRMYYVEDLNPNFGEIMGTIMSVIDPESWMDGDSFMDMHYPTRSLAIRQFEDNHALIEDLLGTLREINDKEQMASVSPVAEQINPRPLTLRERMRARAAASPMNRIYR